MTYQVDDGYQNGYDNGQASAGKAYKKALKEAIYLIEGLADQQAMSDDSYIPGLNRLKDLVANIEQEQGVIDGS